MNRGQIMNLPLPEVCQALIESHARIGEAAGAEELDKAQQLLTTHGLQWSDWSEFFALTISSPSSLPNKQRLRFLGLHAAMGRASTDAQRKHARNALN